MADVIFGGKPLEKDYLKANITYTKMNEKICAILWVYFIKDISTIHFLYWFCFQKKRERNETDSKCWTYIAALR